LTRAWRRGLAIAAGVVAALLLGLGAFPVGLLKSLAENRLAAATGAPVRIGAITRDSAFSFAPTIALRDLDIAQPGWAGTGQMVELRAARFRLPMLGLLLGRVHPQSVRIEGLRLALIRDAQGRANWRHGHGGGGGDSSLPALEIADARFTLADAKRHLDLAGSIAADRGAFEVTGSGRFDGHPAQLAAHGPALAGGGDWPFTAHFASPVMDVTARGHMAHPLALHDMALTLHARGDDLRHLDDLIQAGLFGSQAIDLTGQLRRQHRDWFIDRLSGTIGRSPLTGHATILKRDGRNRIEGAITFAALDFNDLSSSEGLAKGAALKAAIGPRVIPNTKIDLHHLGPTDGTLYIRADRLLFDHDSAFQSLEGTLVLDHRRLRIEHAVARLRSGRLTGWLEADSRHPVTRFAAEFRIEGAQLATLIGHPDTIAGPARGLVRIAGPGATIREAFAHGEGRVAFVADSGTIQRSVAQILGENLGGAIGAKLGGDGPAPLRCAILSFGAHNGVLVPDPLLIDTGVSVGRGSGSIDLDGEHIALTLTGSTRGRAALKLADPVRIGGTLSAPEISFTDDRPGEGGGILKALGRSLGAALGITHRSEQPPAPSGEALDCAGLAARALK
jgi:uncharacterized protein involved in outer membrane biogenesis